MAYEIEITSVASRVLAVTRFHVRVDELGDMGERMGAAFGRVMAHLGRAGINPAGPAVAAYERAEGGFEVAAGFPVPASFEPGDGVERLDLPAGEVAHTTHVGAYDELPAAYAALSAGAVARGRALDDAAPMWEEYWSGPDAPPEQTRTEVFWPLASAGDAVEG